MNKPCPQCRGPWDDPFWHQCIDQPKGRNWRWTATEEFSELCQRVDCRMTDATHYHRPEVPQNAPSEPTAPVTPDMALQSRNLSQHAASEKNPLKRCVVCGTQGGVGLTVAPACDAHSSPVALEQELARLRAGLAWYGQHEEGCRGGQYPHNPAHLEDCCNVILPCTCGLAALLAAAP